MRPIYSDEALIFARIKLIYFQIKFLYLLLKVAGPLVPTVAGPSMLNLECPSFLSVFITDLQYGRKLGNWEPCHMIKEG